MNWKFWKKEEKKEMSLWVFSYRKDLDEIIQKSILDNLPLDLDNTDWDFMPVVGSNLYPYYYKRYIIPNEIISFKPNDIIDEEVKIKKYIKVTEDYQQHILYNFRVYYNQYEDDHFIVVKIFENDKYDILKKLD